MTHLILDPRPLGYLLLEAVCWRHNQLNLRVAWSDGDAGRHLDTTSGSCQCTHRVQHHSKTNLKAERYFTSDTSLQQVNRTLYSFCCCRNQEELSTSLLCLFVQNGFRISPLLPSPGSKHSQRFSKLVTQWYWGPLSCCPIHTCWVKQVARYDARRNSPSLKWERIGGSLCLSSEVQRAVVCQHPRCSST